MTNTLIDQKISRRRRRPATQPVAGFSWNPQTNRVKPRTLSRRAKVQPSRHRSGPFYAASGQLLEKSFGNVDSLRQRVPFLSAADRDRLRGLVPWALLAIAMALLSAGLLQIVSVEIRSYLALKTIMVAPTPPLNQLQSFVGLGSSNHPTDEVAILDFTESFGWKDYLVQSGDSVSSIAARFSLSIGSIIAANAIDNVKRLPVGKQLRIPNMDGLPYTVKSGDSLSRIAAGQGIPMEALIDANDLDSDRITPGQVLFLPGAKMNSVELKLALGELMRYPVAGVLSSGYGWRNDPFTGVRRFHAAIDLAAPSGTAVKAAMDGKIASLGFNAVYGNYIIVNHDGGFQTWYAHLRAFKAEKGAFVQQGQLIGEVGSTGYSTGPHLHFAVFKNGQAVNPLTYLTK